jgi:uncharacterized membrane protein
MGVGAAAMALLALVTGVVPAGVRAAAAVAAVVAGGVAGAVLDSVLGATVQERRRCADCGATTEQHRHTCGAETVRTAGVAGVGNDLVNAAATVTGAAVAAWVALRAG